jgi:hypothetical protein
MATPLSNAQPLLAPANRVSTPECQANHGTPRLQAATQSDKQTKSRSWRSLEKPYTMRHQIKVGSLGTRPGNKRRTAAKAETTGCWLASHRAFDLQPRDRSRQAVLYRAPRRCAPATRFQQCTVPSLSVSISNRTTVRPNRTRNSDDRPARLAL